MTEIRVEYQPDQHSLMMDGVFVDDSSGGAMPEFPLIIFPGEAHVLDTVLNNTFEILSTIVIEDCRATLIINEETGKPNYVVEYNQRHQTHTIPCQPPIRITLVDF